MASAQWRTLIPSGSRRSESAIRDIVGSPDGHFIVLPTDIRLYAAFKYDTTNETMVKLTAPLEEEQFLLTDSAVTYDSNRSTIYFVVVPLGYYGDQESIPLELKMVKCETATVLEYDECPSIDDSELSLTSTTDIQLFVEQDRLHLFSQREHVVFNTVDETTSKEDLQRNDVVNVLFFPTAKRCFLFTADKMVIFTANRGQLALSREIRCPWTIAEASAAFDRSEQYILLVARKKRSAVTEECDIFVYETRSELFYQPSIQCPTGESSAATIVGSKSKDELLVFGYVRHLYSRAEFSDVCVLPLYLITPLIRFVCIEYVHLMERRSSGHWKINFDDIFNSLRLVHMK